VWVPDKSSPPPALSYNRGKMHKRGVDPSHPPIIEDETLFVLSRGWAEMIKKVYQIISIKSPQ
jgi:hypothetical protein